MTGNEIRRQFLAYFEKLERGLKDFQEGKVISHQEMKDEILKWKTQKS